MKITCSVIRMGHPTRHGRVYSRGVFEEIVRQAMGAEFYGVHDNKTVPMDRVLDEKTADFRVKNVRLEGDVLVADVDALTKDAKTTFVSEELTRASNKASFLSISPVLHGECEGSDVLVKGLVLRRFDIGASPAYWEMIEMQRETDHGAMNEVRQREGRKPLPPLPQLGAAPPPSVPASEKHDATPGTGEPLLAGGGEFGFDPSGFEATDTADEKYLDLPSDFSVDEESS